MTLDEFFAGNEASRRIFDVLRGVVDSISPAKLRVSKSQVAFRRRKAFAWAWIPGIYLRSEHAPLVPTLSFHRRDTSPRWKQIVEPAPRRFTHHLELHSTVEIDDEVRTWLQQAWTGQLKSHSAPLFFSSPCSCIRNQVAPPKNTYLYG
jgi:hypothetical protein